MTDGRRARSLRGTAVIATLVSAVIVSTGVISSSGVFPGSNGTIAFSKPSGIWIVDADGSNPQLLIADGFDAAWSPDGSQITYARFGPDSADIYVADADGSNEVQITSSGENREPTFSSSGSNVIFVRSGARTDLVMKAADGTGPLSRLTDSPAFIELSPSASPDGTRITFSGFRGNGDLDIYTIDRDGGDRQRLTSGPKDEFGSSWSPDAARIVFTRIDRGDTIDDVFVMDADGSDLERLTDSRRADVAQSFSPDGTKIVMLRCCFGRQERPRLAVIDADGSNKTQLVRFGFDADWQALVP